MTPQDCAVIFGDDAPGSLGAAIARRVKHEGLAVQQTTIDAADRAALEGLFAQLERDGRRPALVVHAIAPGAAAAPALEASIAEASTHWRRICHAGGQIGQVAIPRLLAAQQGTLLFLAPADSPDAGIAAAAAGLRSFAQSMAREFGPQNLHVAYVALGESADTEAVAHSVWQLHRQHRTTWTQELDLLP